MASSDAEDRDSVNGAEEEPPGQGEQLGKQVRKTDFLEKPVKM